MKYLVSVGPLLAAVGVRGHAASTGRSGTPVERVVNLLKELKESTEHDARVEQATYDKYACWCQKTSKRKADMITEARDTLKTLGQDIISLKGKAATLQAEIKDLLASMKENEESQKEATVIRQKENAAFLAESGEMQQALGALDKAMTLLKSSFLQKGSTALLQKRSSEARQAAEAAAKQLSAVVASLPAHALTGKTPFAKAAQPEKLQQLRRAISDLQSGSASKYAPQSDSITGILKEMYKTLAKDLESQTEAEATKNKDFEDLIALKTEELQEHQESSRKKTAEKAETNVLLSETIENYDDTDRQMQADIEFFDATKEACTDKASEWTTRSELRTEELEGIKKALEILSSDDARELFSKAINRPGAQAASSAPSFLEISAVTQGMAPPVKSAYEALKAQASATHSLRLARLAAKIGSRAMQGQQGHFDDVLKSIDDMIKMLHEEGQDDAKKKEQCKEEFQTVASTLGDVNWKIEKNHARIEKLESLIEKKEEEKAQTEKAIEEVKQQQEEMTEQRNTENEAFLQAKKDDEDAIALLEEAKGALSAYFEKNEIELGPIEGVAFSQKGKKGDPLEEPHFARSEDDAPDAEFSDKSKNKNQSKGIVGILTMILEDLQGEIDVSTKEEDAAQAAYDKAMEAAKKLQGELEEKKTNLEETIAGKKEDKTDEEGLLEENEATKKETEDYKAKITPDCDWILGAFDKRANHRAAEVDGLTKAKHFLVGYKAAKAEAEGAAASAALLRVKPHGRA
eukprot:TRINITY_DN15704_c0_g3_i1.p2 TRINITY_DN15704_c0_g3~~TRINITY_DN15704_c0_g3_i1.p2  ORF type:complete len:750 (+),score=365.43 TRINITY_DN15704_c0_g3_i1:59-2308(+)